MKYILLLILMVSCTVSKQIDSTQSYIEYDVMDTFRKEIIEGFQIDTTQFKPYLF